MYLSTTEALNLGNVKIESLGQRVLGIDKLFNTLSHKTHKDIKNTNISIDETSKTTLSVSRELVSLERVTRGISNVVTSNTEKINFIDDELLSVCNHTLHTHSSKIDGIDTRINQQAHMLSAHDTILNTNTSSIHNNIIKTDEHEKRLEKHTNKMTQYESSLSTHISLIHDTTDAQSRDIDSHSRTLSVQHIMNYDHKNTIKEHENKIVENTNTILHHNNTLSEHRSEISRQKIMELLNPK